MLSTMARMGLVLSFDNGGAKGLRLTVQRPYRCGATVYECSVRQGVSALIVRAWADYQEELL